MNKMLYNSTIHMYVIKTCSVATFKRLLWFSQFIFCSKSFVFQVVLLLIFLPSNNLKFVCLSRVYFLSYKSRREFWTRCKLPLVVCRKFWTYVRYFLQGQIKIFFEFWFSSYFWISAQISNFFLFLFFCCCWKSFVFLVMLVVFPCDSSSVWAFFWAKNEVKIDLLSQNLHMFSK